MKDLQDYLDCLHASINPPEENLNRWKQAAENLRDNFIKESLHYEHVEDSVARIIVKAADEKYEALISELVLTLASRGS